MAKAKTAETEKPGQELEVIKTKMVGMQKMVSEVVIKDDKDLNDVSDKIKQIKMLGKFIEQEKDKYVRPAKEIIAQAKLKYDPYIAECEEAEDALKNKAQTFMVEQDRLQKIGEAKIKAKLESGKIKEATAEKQLEKLPEVKKTATTEKSSLTLKMIKAVEVFDEGLIPDEYWVIDTVKLNKVVKAGLEVPGARLIDKPSMSSN